ncbi:MAG: hypothetical protein HC802_14610 [Caldilineaceae bacterium]|nr:hypothetical protein [Caldilineaceae bacterium]
MADAVATTVVTDDQVSESNSIMFKGSTRNFIPAVAMIVASVMAFSMGMTEVFFAEATAWTFLIWGALLVYANLMSTSQTYAVTDEALVMHNPMRPWGAHKVWDWDHIYRMDVVVKRREAQLDDAVMQFYFTEAGEIAMEREDRDYDPKLAALIIERARLTPDASNPLAELEHLPEGQKGVYTWNR